MIFNRDKIKILFLGLIFLAGIFLRTWNFSDLLRFNPDQARDANIVKSVVEKGENWPLIGPQAGGTDFRLGPVFYYFQITAGKIFGIDPEKLAYPDLIFSIISIGLIYLFLRKYFDPNIALFSMGLFAVSFFAVKYSRFAWNPNSIPFFLLLIFLSLGKLSRRSGRKKIFWASITGISLGIAIQLHTILLFSLPIFSLIILVLLYLRKNPAWKWAPLVIFLALLVNGPQFLGEFGTGGENSKAFFDGLEKKSSREGNFSEKIALNGTCHVQGLSFIATSAGSAEECDFFSLGKNWREKNMLLGVIFSVIFVLGGYWFLILAYKKEKNEDKKIFLENILIYSGIIFLILIPLAREISMRFFILLEFLPFLFLSFWAKFFWERKNIFGKIIFSLVFVVLLILNIKNIIRQLDYLSGKGEPAKGGFEEITLFETKKLAAYFKNQRPESGEIYIDGKTGDISKIIKPLQYFSEENNLEILEKKRPMEAGTEDKIYLLDPIKNPGQKITLPEGARVCDKIGRIKICEMKNEK